MRLLTPFPPSIMSKTKEPDKMSIEDLIQEIDNTQEQIVEFEEHPLYQKYLHYKIYQEACAERLREEAKTHGSFNSQFFQFQKVEVEKTDWKAVCRLLVETKKVKSPDMEGAITTCTETKPQGKMIKLKKKDISLKLS